MATDNVKKFLEALQEDPRAQELISDFEKPENMEELLKTYKELAAKLDIDLTEDEISEAVSEEEQNMKDRTDAAADGIKELSDEAIDAVAGGREIHDECKDTFTDKENCIFNDACDNAWRYYPNYLCKKHNLGTK